MKKTIVSVLIGIIFGIASCITAIVAVFGKLCKIPAIRDHMILSIKDFITILLYGENRVTYVNAYKGLSYKNYSASYNYIHMVPKRIMAIKMDTQEQAKEKLKQIQLYAMDHGNITVEEMLDILSSFPDLKYLDSQFGWTEEDFRESCPKVSRCLTKGGKVRYYIACMAPKNLVNLYKTKEQENE